MEAQPPPAAAQGRLQAAAEGLHRALQMPKPKGLLHHRQHRRAVQGRRSVRRFLGIELQLKVEETPQARHPAAAAELKQIRHRRSDQGRAQQGVGTDRPQKLAQIPERAGRQHRIAGCETPVGPMDR
jgi:hypothetical protein